MDTSAPGETAGRRLLWVQRGDPTEFEPHFVHTDELSLNAFTEALLASTKRPLQLGRDGDGQVVLGPQRAGSADRSAGKRTAVGANTSKSNHWNDFVEGLGTADFVTQGTVQAVPAVGENSTSATAISAAAISLLAEQCEACVDGVLQGLTVHDDASMQVAFEALSVPELTRRVKELGALISKRAHCLKTLGATRTAQLSATVAALQSSTIYAATAERYAHATLRWQRVLASMQAAMSAASADASLRPPLRVGDALPQVHTHETTPLHPVLAAHRGAVLVLLRHFG